MEEELAGLNLVQLIDLLEVAPEPAPIPLTPQTPGWAVLAIGMVLVLLAGARWVRRRNRANAYRKAALRELDLAGADLAMIAGILRRTALVAFPRADVATLAGHDWLAFLDRSYAGNGFANGPGCVFADAPFRTRQTDPEAIDVARDWVRRHSQAAVID